jgi:hypothetical protein
MTIMSEVTVAPAAVASPLLRPANLEDYEQIVRLGLAHSLDVPAYEDWSSLWLDNPLRKTLKDFPIGWVLELPSGEIVGTMGTVRSRYEFGGRHLVAAVSRAWFVTAPYRGFALQLIDEYLNQSGVDLFINNAVSVPAYDTFSSLCRRVPSGQWDSISYWVTNPMAVPQCSQDAVRHSPLPKIANAFTVEATDRFDFQFDVFWKELVRQSPAKLLADRSSEALSWHFAAPMRKRRLWTFTALRRGKLRAYCTFTRQDHGFRLPALPHGDMQGLRGMRLVDYQSIEPEIDFLPVLVETALRRCAAEGLYIVENLGRGVPKMHVVDDCAPYRKTLENWKFFYSASDPSLEADLSDPGVWDPSAYDGDASFE